MQGRSIERPYFIPKGVIASPPEAGEAISPSFPVGASSTGKGLKPLAWTFLYNYDRIRSYGGVSERFMVAVLTMYDNRLAKLNPLSTVFRFVAKVPLCPNEF